VYAVSTGAFAIAAFFGASFGAAAFFGGFFAVAFLGVTFFTGTAFFLVCFTFFLPAVTNFRVFSCAAFSSSSAFAAAAAAAAISSSFFCCSFWVKKSWSVLMTVATADSSFDACSA
jgi:hypothetical protein